jgi:hypothetical protein
MGHWSCHWRYSWFFGFDCAYYRLVCRFSEKAAGKEIGRKARISAQGADQMLFVLQAEEEE